ncbi:MAG TPA: glycosyltransferase [Anaerolineales bacterium]|nr:glycosyltransferase [Anaerolineales bacterium]
MEPRLRVLYDGWPLIYNPLSPSALHLWDILQRLPEEVDAILALPEEPPAWFGQSSALEMRIIPQMDTPGGRLRWEQRILPQTAVEAEADVLHLTHNHPPLLSRAPAAVSPTGAEARGANHGLSGRLRTSLGNGGMARGIGLLWPSDLPRPGHDVNTYLLPPIASPESGDSTPGGASPDESLNLPERFILYHGSFEWDELHTLFDAWSWGAGPLGEDVPLLLLGASREAPDLSSLAERYQFGDAMRILPPLTPPAVAALYRRASALIQPGPEAPWGGSIRRALAFSLPIVTTDHPANSAIVGPAAFAIPAGDSRKLGASLITMIVEEEVALRLSEAGRSRASGWNSRGYRSRLGEVYRMVAGNRTASP